MSFLADILREICAENDLGFYVEPRFGYVGYIEFASGQRSFFTGSSLQINHEAASKIALDKDYTAHFLRQSGLKAADGILICSPEFCTETSQKHPAMADSLNGMEAAAQYAIEQDFPLFVKPNAGASGRNIYRVRSQDQLSTALTQVFQSHTKALVQPAITGRDYRVLVLDGKIVLAYQRIALCVCGNGMDTLTSLIEAKTEELLAAGRGHCLITAHDNIASHLQSQDRTLDDIIAVGEIVSLLPNANLSTGGEIVPVLDELSDSFKAICIQAANTIGLTFAGVDVLCADHRNTSADCTILELNSAPGMRNYASLGATQKDKVIEIYRSMVDLLETGQSTL
ncbi:MAG: ATP-dependent carboxylate-amine ligase [Robiginitomaculum sp.]|nr:MAG: ATP-dependent carboxylate-amine ligase [Robiginitomaculum sp.]